MKANGAHIAIKHMQNKIYIEHNNKPLPQDIFSRSSSLFSSVCILFVKL